jgi:hypothetical protein
MTFDVQLLSKIRRLVRAGRYHFTQHAREELEEDGFFEEDVAHCVANCWRAAVHRDAKRGRPRYELEGPALDDRPMSLVCRFGDTGELRVITCWEVEEKK